MSLEALLSPKSVAVIGASQAEGKVGHAVMRNLVAGGFQGRIVPVNPKAKEILGHECFGDIRDASGEIDLAVIAVPTPAVFDAVSSSVDKKVKAVIVLTAGFKETGPQGALVEADIAKICREHGVRMLGPNCVGLINTQHRMNASFATQLPKPGHISVVSQSGALCTSILDWAVGRHLGLAKLISMGNKADLNETHLILALRDDPSTRVIVAYLEQISNGDDFIRAAEEVSAKKPIIVFKAGTTKAGQRAASSHTGSLAGGDIAYGAAFRRAGVIRADTFDAMLDYAMAFAMQPAPKGKRVAIVTNAGGPGIMAADAVEGSGMEVASLAKDTSDALRKRLPPAAAVGNPIDVLGDADPQRYVDAVNTALSDPAVDSVMVMMSPQAMTRPADTALAIASCEHREKPILACFLGGQDISPGREQLAAADFPDYTSPEKAVGALKAMWEYQSWKTRPPRVITRFPVNRRRVERIIQRHFKSGNMQVGEADAKEIFLAYDFRVPEGRAASTADAAVDAAHRVGFPVAMKIHSPDIVHKSDLGGVKLNLNTDDQVRDAFDLMMLRTRQRAPEARIEGVYVEQMCKPGVEVILGMTRDEQFGPMLMFGLGGIFVEVMKDVAFHLAPITSEEAMQMLVGTKSFALLEGVRGRKGVEVSAVAEGLQRISQLVTDFPQIAEMDINPFILGPAGTMPLVADGRITLRERRVSR